MDIIELKEKMKTVQPMSDKMIVEYLHQYVECRSRCTMICFSEECSELIQALTKCLRGIYQTSNVNHRLAIVEEVTDVKMTLSLASIQLKIPLASPHDVSLEDINILDVFKTLIHVLGCSIRDASDVMLNPDDYLIYPIEDDAMRLGVTESFKTAERDLSKLLQYLHVLQQIFNITEEEIKKVTTIKLRRDIDRGHLAE